MITFNGLPLYRATLAGNADGVVRVSLVEDPAVQSDFEYFKAQKAPVLYAVQNEDKRLVRGVVLRADYPIFRKDSEQDPGYYVTFGADVIRQAAERFLTDGHANDVNLDHLAGSDVDGVQLVQLFIKDTAAGVSPEGFADIADGSLFAEYHVTNDDVWSEIKAGTFKGFSVEIFYTLIPAGDAMRRQEDDDAVEVTAMLRRIIQHITDMTKLQNLKARLARILAEFGSTTTDKGVIYWEGDEDLKAGDRVQVEDSDGNRVDAADGDYVTSDNKTIVIVDGAVSEIKDPEAEVASEESEDPEDNPEQMARQRSARFEESYDEKQRKIVDAIRTERGNREDDYGYLASAGDDFGVWAYYSEETGWQDKFVRYSITWDEEGNAKASDPVECRMAFVPMDFDDATAFAGKPAEEETATAEEYEAAVQAAADFKAENATLKARIAELEKAPAKPGVKERYQRQEDGSLLAESTGDRGLDRLARIPRK